MTFRIAQRNLRLSGKAVCLGLLLVCSVTAQVPGKKTNLTRDDRDAWRKVLAWPDDCEDAFRKTYGASGSRDYAGLDFFSLGRKEYLVKVACFSGAYQPGFVFMYFDEGEQSSQLLKFKRYERDEGGRVTSSYDSEILGFETFDRKTRRLEIVSKSRGAGDCGSLVNYEFVKGRPVVVEARAQPCYDNPRRATVDTRRWLRVKKL